jgi:hypothetical protein
MVFYNVGTRLKALEIRVLRKMLLNHQYDDEMEEDRLGVV